ncbi:MAG: PAS domain S-box protein [Gammaproteobacteria bacterium]|nr:PAS domain S-box protein [Gammaproteobacteria bacterium]
MTAQKNTHDFNLTQAVLESMNAIVVVLDNKGRIEQFNQACKEKTGYSFEEVENKEIWKILIPDSVRDNVRKVFYDLKRTSIPGQYENAWVAKDGSLIQISWHNSVVEDEHGDFHIVAMGVDITEKRQTEYILNELQQRCRLHIESTPMALIDWDTDFNVVAWNPAAETIFGYSAEEAIGKHAIELIVPESVKEHIDHIWNDLLQQEGAQRSTNINITKDGRKITCEWYNTPLIDKDGKIIGVTSLTQDITERVQAEETIKKSEARFSYLMQSAPSVIYTCELYDGKYIPTFVSKNILEFFGYEPEYCLSEPDFWVENIHPDDKENVVANFIKAIQEKNRKNLSHEYRFKLMDGDYCWVRDDVNLIRGLNGEVTEIIGSWMDITGLKNADATQKGLEKRFQDLLETTTDWIWEVDAQGCYTFASGSIESVLGYTPEEIIGTTPFDLMPADEAERIGRLFSNIVANKRVIKDLENWNLSKNGELVCLLTNGVPILDEHGELTGYRGVDKDITARKESEDILKRNEEKFRSIVETTAEGFWMIDPISKCTLEVNEALCNMLGYDEAEMLGKTPMDFVDEDNQQIFIEQTSKIGNTNHRVYDVTLNKKDGTELYTHFNATTLRNEKQGAIAAYAFVTDLSQHYKVEQALINAKEESDRANNAKSSFLSSISHELRTPMNAMMGFAQLLNLGMSGELNDKQQQAVENIMKAGNHLTDLIDQVLELSKVEAGELAINNSEVNYLDVLKECLVLVQPRIDETGVRVIKDYKESDFPVLVSDSTRLKQVLLNLITNAVKYNSENGEIVLSVKEQSNNIFRVCIKDTGTGIPVDKHDNVFKPFDRLGKEAGTIEGTGIGLTLSKKIMELLGGDIGFESQEGKGTVFWIDVPMTRDKPVGLRNELVDEFSLQHRCQKEECPLKTVLYIEDNPLSMDLMKIVVEEFPNINMLSANTGDKGIQLAIENHPDLILMDINMPGMNGFDALKILQKSPASCDIPVVAVTAAAMPREVDQGLTAGFVDYLIKPIDIKKTMDMISGVLKLDCE